MLSAGLTSHFSIKSQNTEQDFVVQFFQAYTGFVILTTCWSSMDAGPPWLFNNRQQSLANSNVYYLLWSHVEYRIVFFTYLTLPGTLRTYAGRRMFSFCLVGSRSSKYWL